MGKIAFLFSGQGAQAPGMGLTLAAAFQEAESVFDMAEAIRPGTRAQCAGVAPDALGATRNVQPCLFAAGLAAAEALRARGVQADMAAGFSLGEIPALAFSGVMPPEAAFRLVCVRAEAMQACAEEAEGGMAVVTALPDAAVEAVCAKYGVYPVNYNCPGQLVIAGGKAPLAEAWAALKAAGGRVMPLRVGGAFHTPAMEAAREALFTYLLDKPLADPSIPLYANITARPYAPPYGELISRQVVSPVRFRETLESMARAGADTFIEVGVGRTLSGFVKKTLPEALALAVEDPESLEGALRALAGAT